MGEKRATGKRTNFEFSRIDFLPPARSQEECKHIRNAKEERHAHTRKQPNSFSQKWASQG